MNVASEKISAHCTISNLHETLCKRVFFSQFFPMINLYVRCIRIFGRICRKFFYLSFEQNWFWVDGMNYINWNFCYFLDFISIYNMHFWQLFFSKLNSHLSWAIISNYSFAYLKIELLSRKKSTYAWCHM